MRRPGGKGRFIVLEGIDGSGTTTQAQLLGEALRREGHRVLLTREPSDGPVGGLIRQVLRGRVTLPRTDSLGDQVLALSFAADRLDHLGSEVLPSLGRGEVVVCDRYLLSSLAYQGAAAPMKWVERINAQAIRPDLTIFIEVAPSTAALRRLRRGEPKELFETAARQRKVARLYLKAIKNREKKERIIRVDGNRPLQEVATKVLESARAVLARAGRVSVG
jgi:dTMP kinase